MVSKMKKLDKVCIVGLGLIGSSIGMAIRKKRLALKVYGLVRRKASIEEARRYSAVDTATMDARKAASGAELIILATPVGVMGKITEGMLPFLEGNCIVTDVGSSKRMVVEQMEGILHGRARFIGGHPMAGSEQRGMRAAQWDLFNGAPCILTPTGRTEKGALAKVRKLWENLGSKVSLLSPREHDHIIAAVSHLPHVMAAALMNYLGRKKKDVLLYSGSGLRDLTRIAAGFPDLWTDICLSNRDELVKVIDGYCRYLGAMRKALQSGERGKLHRALTRAKVLRDKL